MLQLQSLLTIIVVDLLFTATGFAATTRNYSCDAVKKSAKVGAWSKDTVDLTKDKERMECRFSVNGATASSPRTNTYECTIADKSTMVSAGIGYIIDLTEDKERKECRFSVNGADVGSPPIENVISGLNRVIAGRMPNDLEKGEVQALAYSLIASSPETRLEPDLIETLQKQSGKLRACFNDFGHGSSASALSTMNNNQFIKSIADKPSGPLKRETISAERPCLILSSDSWVSLELGGFGSINVKLSEPVLAIAITRPKGLAHILFIPRRRIGGSPIQPN